VVNNPTMASVVGIDLDRVYLWSYAIGSAMVVPIALINLVAKGANPDMGLPVMLAAAIAVFVGGLGYIPGALAAGLLVGVLENLGVFWIGSEWQSSIAFAVLIAFLLWRPNGFFGERVRRVQV
jgi:branched-chain amino acid transport system permease protein